MKVKKGDMISLTEYGASVSGLMTDALYCVDEIRDGFVYLADMPHFPVSPSDIQDCVSDAEDKEGEEVVVTGNIEYEDEVYESPLAWLEDIINLRMDQLDDENVKNSTSDYRRNLLKKDIQDYENILDEIDHAERLFASFSETYTREEMLIRGMIQ